MGLNREEIFSAIYHCAKCKLCSIASFHQNEEWLPLCPSGQFYGYQAFYAPGRIEIFREILDGELSEPTEGLLKAIYACTLCGACYEKCKQISSVEIRLPELFEEMRGEMVKKGWALDTHKDIVKRLKRRRIRMARNTNTKRNPSMVQMFSILLAALPDIGSRRLQILCWKSLIS